MRRVSSKIRCEDLSCSIFVAFIGSRRADGVVWTCSCSLQTGHSPLNVEKASCDVVYICRRVRKICRDWWNIQSSRIPRAVAIVVFGNELWGEVIGYCWLSACMRAASGRGVPFRH